jgi:hypothetical protein
VNNYRIQHTNKNDYIVRPANLTDNHELGRFATESEAEAHVAQLETERTERLARLAQAVADEQAYRQATLTLAEAQLTWQEWRTWFYDAMKWAAKGTAAMQRALDMKAEQYAGRPAFEKQEGHLAEAMREDVEAARLYTQAQALDVRIKAARRNRDTAALAEALAEAPAMIGAMQPYFQTVGLPPPEPPKRSGTAPNASLILNSAELAFIEDRFGGSKSAAIHAALAALKRSE